MHHKYTCCLLHALKYWPSQFLVAVTVTLIINRYRQNTNITDHDRLLTSKLVATTTGFSIQESCYLAVLFIIAELLKAAAKKTDNAKTEKKFATCELFVSEDCW